MIGKAVRFAGKGLARGMARPPVAAGLVGGAAAAGGISALLDETGPFPTVQEQAIGSRRALKYSMKAGVINTFNPNVDNIGFEDYYYGRPTRSMGADNRRVPGELVFGAYNRRRS